MSKVSVIIPAYNSAKYICSAIDSVLQQSYKDIEIIVVDDGSTDNTKEVLKNYASGIKYIYQENGGPAKARNTGIKNAIGEYIAFLDSDDLWAESKLELQIHFMENNPNVGLVFSDMINFHDDTKHEAIYLSYTNHHDNFKARHLIISDCFIKLLGTNFIPTPSVVVRKKCFDSSGLFNEELTVAEDVDMWLRIALSFEIGYISQPFVKRRLHGQNLTSNIEPFLRQSIVLLRNLSKDRYCFNTYHKKKVYGRLKRSYYELGYYLFSRGIKKEAIKWFLFSVSLTNLVRPLFYLVIMSLPLKLIGLLKNMKNGLRFQ